MALPACQLHAGMTIKQLQTVISHYPHTAGL
jgi:hypothetical protein